MMHSLVVAWVTTLPVGSRKTDAGAVYSEYVIDSEKVSIRISSDPLNICFQMKQIHV
jgi:hypothetical protein